MHNTTSQHASNSGLQLIFYCFICLSSKSPNTKHQLLFGEFFFFVGLRANLMSESPPSGPLLFSACHEDSVVCGGSCTGGINCSFCELLLYPEYTTKALVLCPSCRKENTVYLCPRCDQADKYALFSCGVCDPNASVITIVDLWQQVTRLQKDNQRVCAQVHHAVSLMEGYLNAKGDWQRRVSAPLNKSI